MPVTDMDAVFRALADPSRRRLLDGLNDRNGQRLRELAADLDMTRQAVTKHLAALEAAGLVTTLRSGREKLHYLNAAPINDIADRWIGQYHRERARALADLKRALEDDTMPQSEFVYVTYIQTTPERLWQALTDPEFTSRYWGVRFQTDWQPGSGMTWEEGNYKVTDPEQVVLESDPYRHLSYTWHTFTPEWAEYWKVGDAAFAKLGQEPRSKVTFDLEPAGSAVKLTVTHDGFEPDSEMLKSISQGWPGILSSLKTLLETDEALVLPD